jgi:hypothetical protein
MIAFFHIISEMTVAVKVGMNPSLVKIMLWYPDVDELSKRNFP